MARKRKRPDYKKRPSVFKEQLEAGTLPRAKTWGKKDRTPKQDRQEDRKSLRDQD
jgi:hypothetical protein